MPFVDLRRQLKDQSFVNKGALVLSSNLFGSVGFSTDLEEFIWGSSQFSKLEVAKKIEGT